MSHYKNLHRDLCLILSNTVVLFLFLNLFLWIKPLFFSRSFSKRTFLEEGAPDFRDRNLKSHNNPILYRRHEYQSRFLDMRSFENVPEKEVYQALEDYLFRAPFRFEPYSHYSETPYDSPSIHVDLDETGTPYRRGKSSLSPPSKTLKIYLFGGSTVYGTHLRDEWTLAHALQTIFEANGFSNIEVRNYGRSGFSWFEEFILFQDLLHQGHRPLGAIFLDGVNYRMMGAPKNIPPRWNLDQSRLRENRLPNWIPLFRAINHWANQRKSQEFLHWQAKMPDDLPESLLLKSFNGPEEKTKFLKNHYHSTINMTSALAKRHSIRPLFLWQPAKDYRCGREKYRMSNQKQSPSPLLIKLWEEMESFQGDNFVNLSHLCESYGLSNRIILDNVHYSPDFNRYLAEKIFEILIKKNWVGDLPGAQKQVG